jgi:hypothetical protein
MYSLQHNIYETGEIWTIDYVSPYPLDSKRKKRHNPNFLFSFWTQIIVSEHLGIWLMYSIID